MAKKVLGRGLGALLSDNVSDTVSASGEQVIEVALSAITPNPHQPRKSFPMNTIQELADSIREKGVLQPLLLRPSGRGGYEIVAGERRYRAAEMIGRTTVPAVIREIPDRELLEFALVENIQREDLGPIELATALDRLIHDCGYTHQELAARLGKDRSSITNALRLLKLAEPAREALARSEITAGHARALAGIEATDAQGAWCARVVREGLSVRALEKLLESSNSMRKPRRLASPAIRRADASLTALVEKLQSALGTRVHVRASGTGGRIEIEYYSQEELERLLGILLSETP